MAEIEHVMEEVARFECVYHRNSKDFKDKHKKANCNCWNKIGQKFNLSAGEAEAKFRNIRTVYARYLKRLKTLPSGSRRDAVPREFQNLQWLNTLLAAKLPLPRPPWCLLFSLHARVYLTLPLIKTYGYGRLCDRCDYMETDFFAIVCDCLRSAICDLRSSVIVCDHMKTSLKGEVPWGF